MNNSSTLSRVQGHLADDFLANPQPHSHAVQFYDEEPFLFDTVARYLASGLLAGEWLVLIATRAHAHMLLHRLEPLDVRASISAGRLTVLDAEQALSRFMVGELPDPDRFLHWIAHTLAMAQSGQGREGIRMYGEMVDLLSRRGNARGALRLEELFNLASARHSFALLCAHGMGAFCHEHESERFREVCGTHTHVLPTERFAQLTDLQLQLREISLLEQRARSLETELQRRDQQERALRAAHEQPNGVESELITARSPQPLAHQRADVPETLEDEFLGMIGNDLRSPLKNILTTARLMVLRGELARDSEQRLGRVVSNAERMQRMIEQMLDVTRIRLGDGILLQPDGVHDLGMMVWKVVDEHRVSNPLRVIEVEVRGSCLVRVDRERVEQVLSNLIGNAVMHGDPDRLITVRVHTHGGAICASVHNYGVPIDERFIPLLFDPFGRVAKSQANSNGLGLGLYISRQIVQAHGGSIEVHSSEQHGTRFDVVLPSTSTQRTCP